MRVSPGGLRFGNAQWERAIDHGTDGVQQPKVRHGRGQSFQTLSPPDQFEWTRSPQRASITRGMLPVRFGMVASEPKTIQTRLNAMAQSIVDDLGYPGAVIGFQRGKDQLFSVAGVANLDTQEPMTEEHRFFLGSVSKPPIGVLVLQQIESGHYTLDTPIQQLLDKDLLSAAQIGAETPPIPVRQLLNHTSGLSDFINREYLAHAAQAQGRSIPLREALAFTQKDPGPRVSQGEFRYGNTGYELLGALLEKTAGQPLETLLQTRILRPLGLTQMSVAPQMGVGPMAQGASSIDPQSGQLTDTLSPKDTRPWARSMVGHRASGILIGTAQDVLTLYRGMLTPHRLLSPTSLQAMLKETVAMGNHGRHAYKSGYGLGLCSYNDGQFYFHNGNNMGYQSVAMHNPSSDTTVVVLVNGDRPNTIKLLKPVHKLLLRHEIPGILKPKRRG